MIKPLEPKPEEKVAISFVMSVHPHQTTQFPVDEFSWNLIFEYSEMCQDNSGFIKSDKGKVTLCEDQCTFVIISHWIRRISNVSDKGYREDQNTFLCSVTFSRILCRL